MAGAISERAATRLLQIGKISNYQDSRQTDRQNDRTKRIDTLLTPVKAIKEIN